MNVSGEPPSIADAASWAVATAVTKTAREQLAYLLEQRDVVEKISQRFGSLELPQRQGHVFEWMHELTYNLDAIAKNDATRLRVTTWLGQPHDPADLRLVGPSGEVLREAQAKVIERTAARLSAQHGVSSDKYVGMDLLVPGNHLGDARDLIGRRLAMPEGPLHDRYRDVGDRLSNKVSHGRVSSQPVESSQLRAAAEDPDGYLRELLRGKRLDQLAKAGGAAAVTAAAVSAVVEIALVRVRNGSFAGVPWTEVASHAAKAAVSAAVIAIGAQSLSLGAQQALATGASGASGALAHGSLPFALMQGTWSVAGSGYGWATGKLDPGEAALMARARSLRVPG